MVELRRAKLFIPWTRASIVARPGVGERQKAALDKKLTLTAAPAGFGKTTLRAAWLRQIDHPAVWQSLDQADNNPPRFPAYLAATFRQVDEEIGEALASTLQSPQLHAIKTENIHASHN